MYSLVRQSTYFGLFESRRAAQAKESSCPGPFRALMSPAAPEWSGLSFRSTSKVVNSLRMVYTATTFFKSHKKNATVGSVALVTFPCRRSLPVTSFFAVALEGVAGAGIHVFVESAIERMSESLAT